MWVCGVGSVRGCRRGERFVLDGLMRDADYVNLVSNFGDNFVTKLLHNLLSKGAVRAKLM